MILFKAWFSICSLSFLVGEWFKYRVQGLFFKAYKSPEDLDKWLGEEAVKFSTYMYKLLKIDFEIENPEMVDKVDWSRNVFVTGNHQSYMDIPALYLSVQKHLLFVAKKDLVKIPVLGYWLKEMGSILLDRKQKNAGLEVAKILKDKDRAFNMVVFCEGQRSKTGKIGNLKSGLFRYADSLDGIILPLTIEGAYETWEGRKKIFKRYKVKCRILDPIDFRDLEAQGKTFQNVRRDLQAVYREKFEGRVFK